MAKLLLGCIFSILACLAASAPWGVHTQAMNAELIKALDLVGENGVIVLSVDNESAAKGVLEQGDVILGVNGRKIHSPQEFDALAKITKFGEIVHLLIKPKNAPITTVNFIPAKIPELSLESIDDKILGNVELEQTADGVTVRRANSEGLLQTADKIIEINNHRIRKISDLKNALKTNDKSLSIVLDRRGAQIVQSFAVNDMGNSFFSQTIVTEP